MHMEQPLHWVRTGTDHPETVVLLHAVGYDLTYWDRQIEALCGRYNVVAVDLPGHGRSPVLSQPWTFDALARLLAALIETVADRPVHLAGLSFGGMLAQTTALARPDLIRSLALLGTASTFPEPVRVAMRARAAIIRAQGMAAVLGSSLERWFSADTRTRRPDLIERVTRTILADDPTTQADIWDLIASLDVMDRLPEIACPTLLLVGEQDASTPPKASTAMAERLPNARMVVIPEAAHIVTLEKPLAVNRELMLFLGEQ